MERIACLALLIVTLLCTSCAAVSPCTGNTSMTDANITTSVQVQLAHDRGLNDLAINVTTYERIVTLSGNVQNPTQRDIAIQLACSVPGVRNVISKLKIVRLKY